VHEGVNLEMGHDIEEGNGQHQNDVEVQPQPPHLFNEPSQHSNDAYDDYDDYLDELSDYSTDADDEEEDPEQDPVQVEEEEAANCRYGRAHYLRWFRNHIRSFKQRCQYDRVYDIMLKFVTVKSKNFMKDAAAKGMWNLIRTEFMPQLPTFDIMKKTIATLLPKPHCKFKVKHRITQEVTEFEGTKFDRKRFGDKRQFIVVEESTRQQLDEVHSFHVACHIDNEEDYDINNTTKFDFSTDGVPLDNSSDRNMVVQSVRFENCRQIYTISVNIIQRGLPFNIELQLRDFIKQLQAAHNLHLQRCIGDTPSRHEHKCLIGHCGYMSCELCLSVGERVNGQARYPPNTMHGIKRTNPHWRYVVDMLQELSKDQRFGIKGKSPLLCLPYFDIIRNYMIDCMHLLFLGLGRNLINATFKLKSGKLSRCANVKLCLKDIDLLFLMINLPSECQRRVRSVTELLHFKSNEIRNLVIVGCIIYADSLYKNAFKKQAKIWMIMCYLVRSVFLPDTMRVRDFEVGELMTLHQEFYELYAQEYGYFKCVFIVHAFSHLQEIRELGGPLSMNSSEAFENNYGSVKQSYTPRTSTLSKQISEKMFIQNLMWHSCHKSIKFTGAEGTDSAKVDDSMVCDDNNFFYKVVHENDLTLDVKQIVTSAYRSNILRTLNWSKVGVRTFCQISEEVITINKATVIGKGVLAGKLIISYPIEAMFT
jgi:hypothetical protein